jgi:hypothetical protein
MSISSVNGNLTQALLSPTPALDATSTSSANTAAASATAGGDTMHVSGPGQLLAKLKQLQQSDPEKFKQVMSKLTDALKTDAQNATDPKDQKMLNDLAAKFDAAGQSGDLSSLTPQGAHHGHHHHHGGPSAAGGAPAAPPAPDGAAPSGSKSQWSSGGQEQRHEQMATTMNQLLSIVDSV